MAADPLDSPLDAPPGYYGDSSASKSPEKDSAFSESRYIYYRPYSLDGAIPSKRAFEGGRLCIGRLRTTAVPPPHTVAALKRALLHVEEIADPTGERTGLFQTADSRSAMMEGRVSILTGDLGATPETALALVYHGELPSARTRAPDEEDAAAADDADYLYYRLYTHAGEATSTRPVTSGNPSLARVRRVHIAPPRDSASAKRLIAHAERSPVYAFADLVSDLAAGAPLPPDTPLLASHGATPQCPVLLVQPERRAGLHNRPLLVVTAPEARARGWGWGRSRFLAPAAGDLLHTDGVEQVVNDHGCHILVYTAVNHRGMTGWIQAGTSRTRFLDEVRGSSSCSIQ
ncbi:hypothetical protein B0H15DRAFT_832147 [Mycena belliarum]|uniref:Uncharacterized protein n=1 Tax=Mycena belliarum TaxID=1033014 RepID=A0AAD6XPF0_9AGAR|nr:hypothetical protein B0H15DRAFT_832147 [Mycena belliae]